MVYRFEAVGAQFGNDVPAAVGGVQGAHGRVSAQAFDHLVRAVAFDSDGHQCANLLFLRLRFELDGVAHQGAVFLHSREAVLHRATSDA